jgi:hypothetical protein
VAVVEAEAEAPEFEVRTDPEEAARTDLAGFADLGEQEVRLGLAGPVAPELPIGRVETAGPAATAAGAYSDPADPALREEVLPAALADLAVPGLRIDPAAGADPAEPAPERRSTKRPKQGCQLLCRSKNFCSKKTHA